MNREAALWQLTPEGAVVHRTRGVAVIADVHLGYEWARAAAGDIVPAHCLAETTGRIAALRVRVAFDHLIVAGDLVESPGPCARTRRDVQELRVWLAERGIALTWLRGNHDPRHHGPDADTLDIDGWHITHGHLPIDDRPAILGHFHPCLRAGPLSAPCFLVGANRILLPAFSPNAAGCNVADPRFASGLDLDAHQLHCLVAAENEVLDFGPLGALSDRLQGKPGRAGLGDRRTRSSERAG